MLSKEQFLAVKPNKIELGISINLQQLWLVVAAMEAGIASLTEEMENIIVDEDDSSLRIMYQMKWDSEATLDALQEIADNFPSPDDYVCGKIVSRETIDITTIGE